jgi:hypothetical protein
MRRIFIFYLECQFIRLNEAGMLIYGDDYGKNQQ